MAEISQNATRTILEQQADALASMPFAEEHYRLLLANGVLTHTSAPQHTKADTSLTLPRASIAVLAQGAVDLTALDAAGVQVSGDQTVLGQLFGLLQPGDPDFAIVTP